MMTSDSRDVNQRPHRVILGFLRHEQSEFTIKYFFDLLAKKPIVILNKDVFLKLVGRARKKLKKLVRHCRYEDWCALGNNWNRKYLSPRVPWLYDSIPKYPRMFALVSTAMKVNTVCIRVNSPNFAEWATISSIQMKPLICAVYKYIQRWFWGE